MFICFYFKPLQVSRIHWLDILRLKYLSLDIIMISTDMSNSTEFPCYIIPGFAAGFLYFFLYSIYNTGCKQIILCCTISLLSINIILSLQLILMLFNMINCHHNFINHFGQRCVKHFSESNLYLLWNGKMSHTFTTIDSRQDKFILFMLFFCRLIIVWMLQVKSCCITLSCFITVLLYNKSDSMQIIKPWNFLTSRLLYAFLARFFFISCFCFYWM